MAERQLVTLFGRLINIISGLEVVCSIAEGVVSDSSTLNQIFFLTKKTQKSWDNHNDLAGADTGIILKPLLDFSGTSLGCPILLEKYPRIIPRMLACYEGPSYRCFVTAWYSVPVGEKTFALFTSRYLKEESIAKKP